VIIDYHADNQLSPTDNRLSWLIIDLIIDYYSEKNVFRKVSVIID